MKTILTYKGFDIDPETECPEAMVIYCLIKGEYLDTERFYTIKECIEYIDKFLNTETK